MKKIIFTILSFCVFLKIFGQDTTKTDTLKKWKFGSITTISYNQTKLKYWTAGGDNSIAINGLTNIFLNHKGKYFSWNNSLDLAYGLQKTGNLPFRKNNDKIDFSSKYGFNISKQKLFITTLVSFKTQFTKGFDYKENGDSTLISDFMSPAYLLYALGIDYKPKDFISFYLSPITGKTTFVLNDSLSSVGAFGVDTGKNVRYELGAYLKIEMNKDFNKKFTLATKTTLFSNYLHNPQNIDVSFDLIFAVKLGKYLSINFSNQMLYDDDIWITIDPETGQKGKRLQIKNVLGLGFVLNF